MTGVTLKNVTRTLLGVEAAQQARASNIIRGTSRFPNTVLWQKDPLFSSVPTPPALILELCILD